jgi:hypothetical protein
MCKQQSCLYTYTTVRQKYIWNIIFRKRIVNFEEKKKLLTFLCPFGAMLSEILFHHADMWLVHVNFFLKVELFLAVFNFHDPEIEPKSNFIELTAILE